MYFVHVEQTRVIVLQNSQFVDCTLWPHKRILSAGFMTKDTGGKNSSSDDGTPFKCHQPEKATVFLIR